MSRIGLQSGFLVHVISDECLKKYFIYFIILYSWKRERILIHIPLLPYKEEIMLKQQPGRSNSPEQNPPDKWQQSYPQKQKQPGQKQTQPNPQREKRY